MISSELIKKFWLNDSKEGFLGSRSVVIRTKRLESMRLESRVLSGEFSLIQGTRGHTARMHQR